MVYTAYTSSNRTDGYTNSGSYYKLFIQGGDSPMTDISTTNNDTLYHIPSSQNCVGKSLSARQKIYSNSIYFKMVDYQKYLKPS